ncbi:MAG: hypothetical protein NTV86_14950 [Planctomycetota bacterium]|nr:hypothetical protein [Planctomycetota bacterium]
MAGRTDAAEWAWTMAACLLLAGAARGQQGAGAKEWVGKLNSPDLQVRAEAHKELMMIGEPAGEALRAALKNPALGAEARSRVEFLLDDMERPAMGALWPIRTNQPAPEGIEPGDVVFRIDGRRIFHVQQLGEGERPPRTVEVWHKGKGKSKLSVARGDWSVQGFSELTDLPGLYTRFGQSGVWDGKVLEALEHSQNGRHEPAVKAFEEAWKLGCRDVLVLCGWALELRWAGQARESLALAARLAGEAKDTTPGGLGTYGILPNQLARAHLLLGDRASARRVTAEAIEQAERANAWWAIESLHWPQLELLSDDAAACLAFWEKNRQTIRRVPGVMSEEEEWVLQAVAAQMGMAKARELAGRMPLSAVPERWRKVLAAEPEKAPARRHAVLVDYKPWYGPLSAEQGGYDDEFAFAGKGLGRLDAQVKIVSHGLARPETRSLAALFIEWPGARSVVRMDRCGGVSVRDPAAGMPSGYDGPQIYDPKAWNRLSLAAGPEGLRVSVNDVAMYAGPPSGDDRGPCQARIFWSDCTISMRELTWYMYSATAVDNQAMLALLRAHEQACRASDAVKVAALQKQLLEAAAPSPEAREYLTASLETRRKQLEAMLSKDGLSLCQRDLVKDKPDDGSGRGRRLEGSTLVGWAPAGKSHGAALDLTLPDDLEIVGTVAFGDVDRDPRATLGWWGQFGGAMPTVWFYPRYRTVAIGFLDDSHCVRAEGVDFSTPLPFCLRTRGNKVALFLRDGAKPDLTVENIERSGPGVLLLWKGTGTPQGQIRFQDLRVRALPKDKPLDAPARLPRADEATTTKPRNW